VTAVAADQAPDWPLGATQIGEELGGRVERRDVVSARDTRTIAPSVSRAPVLVGSVTIAAVGRTTFIV